MQIFYEGICFLLAARRSGPEKHQGRLQLLRFYLGLQPASRASGSGRWRGHRLRDDRRRVGRGRGSCIPLLIATPITFGFLAAARHARRGEGRRGFVRVRLVYTGGGGGFGLRGGEGV